MATLEINKRIAVSINPKLAWSGIGNLWGVGLGSNIEILPNIELITEANIVCNEPNQSNITVGTRWHTTDRLSIDIYASSAASILDIGQLISADEVRLGTRVIFTF